MHGRSDCKPVAGRDFPYGAVDVKRSFAGNNSVKFFIVCVAVNERSAGSGAKGIERCFTSGKPELVMELRACGVSVDMRDFKVCHLSELYA